MILDKLILENFRCYSDIEINFDKRLTVIVGDNGAGKTTLLDAIAMLLGRFVSRLPGVTGLVQVLPILECSRTGKLVLHFIAR